MWSPRKLWINGVLREEGAGNHICDVPDPTPEDLSTYGIDHSGPVREPRQQVDIPDTLCPLDDVAKQRFFDCIQLIHSDPNPVTDYGIGRYMQVKQILIH